jgi:CBS domain-containing protein/sporulation protein YlmC with PRC-barrel domain
MADTFLYLTELLGLPVHDLKGRVIGRVKEAAIVPLEDPFRIDRFLVGAGHTWLTVRYDQIRSLSLHGIDLSDELLTPYHSDEYMLRLVRDLLDQQIIDAQGRKVVRVTDITFAIRAQANFTGLYVTEVDIGIRSIFRRLFQGVLPRTWIRKLQAPIQPRSIAWGFCNIIEPDPMRRLRLNISPTQLEEMHPADLADIVEELGPDAREALITSLDSEAAAEALSEVDPEIQASILESLETEKAAEILEEMSPNQAADVLQEMEHATSEELLAELDAEDKTEVEELLEYGEHTAGGMMNTEYLSVPESATVAEAIASLRAATDLSDSLPTIQIVRADDTLVDQIPVTRLFLADASASIKELLNDDTPITVRVDSKESRVTEIFDRYNLLSLPVVDAQSKLVGVITADDVISVLRGRR